MRYKKPTIEQEGGILAHIRNMGLDTDLFVRLVDANVADTAIGRAMRKPPITGHTIKSWKKLLRGEYASSEERRPR